MTRPADVSLAEIADVFGVTPEAIRQWRAKGMPARVVSNRPRFAVAKCVEWRRAQDRRDVLAQAVKTAPKESDERARKLSWDASLAELRYRERMGELVDVAEVERQHERVCRAIRSRVLGTRGRWAPRAIGLTNMTEATQLFDAIGAYLLAALTEGAADVENDEPGEGLEGYDSDQQEGVA